jgi:hypothetical protein
MNVRLLSNVSAAEIDGQDLELIEWGQGSESWWDDES